MRPKDLRIRFLPVNVCAIRAPLGARAPSTGPAQDQTSSGASALGSARAGPEIGPRGPPDAGNRDRTCPGALLRDGSEGSGPRLGANEDAPSSPRVRVESVISGFERNAYLG